MKEWLQDSTAERSEPLDRRFIIGTSGYDYPEWKGAFYPQDLARKEFLPYYARHFNGLELNSTFYSMPDARRMISFMDRTAGHVMMSVKANRLLTHEISRDWTDAADVFRKAIIPLQENGVLSSVLFQLPQSFRYTEENRFYLSDLLKEFQGFPAVVEFRHREWIRESVFAGLVERNVSVAFCDMPALKYLPNAGGSISSTDKREYGLYSQFIGPQAYIRLHGRNAEAWYACDSGGNDSGRYYYSYSESELADFVPVIAAAIGEGRKVSVFFNNHPKGNGVKNARSLRDAVMRKIMS